MKKKILLISIIAVSLFSCLKDYNLGLEKSPRKLVVEGFVSNKKGPYYVRLTESCNSLNLDTSYYWSRNSNIPVLGATVIISDDMGMVDTLKPSPIDSCYWYDYDYDGNIIDSSRKECLGDLRWDRGYYQTQKIQGLAGHSYSLKVKTKQGGEYTASTTLPTCPVIDSMSYIIKSEGKEGLQDLVPLVYFSNTANVRNYYLFNIYNLLDTTRLTQGILWSTLVINGEMFPPYVNGLSVELFWDRKFYNIHLYMYPAGAFAVFMVSVDKDAYLYFKALSQQVVNDGGVYHPASATPPGNISNGALGLFFGCSETSISKEYNIHVK